MTRRDALKQSFILATPLALVGCEASFNDAEIEDIFSHTHSILFPHAKTLGCETLPYLKIILAHSKISQDTKDELINGAMRLNELSIQRYQAHFNKLDVEKQKDMIEYIINNTDFGSEYVRLNLTFILESLLGDPIYRGNTDGKGWAWVKHISGEPRPKRPYL